MPDFETPVPASFRALVRDALAHLYDLAHLEGHPLTQLTANAPHDPGSALRALLLDTIEALSPAADATGWDKEWRTYTILTRRYVDGASIEEIIDELSISPRQFHRELRKALEAVVAMLWHRWEGEGLASQQPAPLGDGLRQEVERIGVVLEHTNLETLVESVRGAAQSLADGHRVSLHVRPLRGPCPAWADPTLARQALLGALSVLVSARPIGIVISGSSSVEAATLELSAQPALELADSSLAVLHGELAPFNDLMRAQGGQLEAVAEGRTLRGVRLILRAARGSRVLLIDDNEQILQLFERYLVSDGFSVVRAGDAAQALSAIERECPAAIVLDVMMRQMDGWQLLERLRGRPDLREVPIVVCSVLNEGNLALALGAQRYLRKPVSQQEMLAALRQALKESNPAAMHPGGP